MADRWLQLARHQEFAEADHTAATSLKRQASGGPPTVVPPDESTRLDSDEPLHLLASIVESSDDAIITKNLDGIITNWNGGAERIFGYAAEEAIGQSVTILIPPDRLDEEPGIIGRIRRGERTDHYETVRRPRGTASSND